MKPGRFAFGSAGKGRPGFGIVTWAVTSDQRVSSDLLLPDVIHALQKASRDCGGWHSIFRNMQAMHGSKGCTCYLDVINIIDFHKQNWISQSLIWWVQKAVPFLKPVPTAQQTVELIASTIASHSQSKPQNAGIRQGCPLSPFLFILVMTVLFHDIADKHHRVLGTCRPEKVNFNEILYADDISGKNATTWQRKSNESCKLQKERCIPIEVLFRRVGRPRTQRAYSTLDIIWKYIRTHGSDFTNSAVQLQHILSAAQAFDF